MEFKITCEAQDEEAVVALLSKLGTVVTKSAEREEGKVSFTSSDKVEAYAVKISSDANTVKVNNVTYHTQKGDGWFCTGCAFYSKQFTYDLCDKIPCTKDERPDFVNVIFTLKP